MNSGDLQQKPIAHSLQYQHCSRVLYKEIVIYIKLITYFTIRHLTHLISESTPLTQLKMNSPSRANWHSSRKLMHGCQKRGSFFLFFFITNYGCRHRNVSGHLSYHIDWLLVAEWGQHANRAKAYKISNIQKKVRDYTLRISLETGSNCPFNQNQAA